MRLHRDEKSASPSGKVQMLIGVIGQNGDRINGERRFGFDGVKGLTEQGYGFGAAK